VLVTGCLAHGCEEAAHVKNARERTILVADDDPGHLLLVEAALAGAGFIVLTAIDGEEAVSEFARVQPDCVILDVGMPKMTGFEACRAIRARADGHLLPILMLTGRNDLAAISGAYGVGATDFAQKGLNPRLLESVQEELVRRRGSGWQRCATSASEWPSTTSAPVTRRSARFVACHSTARSSIAR